MFQRVTRQTVQVLRALQAAAEPTFGLRIVEETGLKTGTVYPVLARLEEFGWVDVLPDPGGHDGPPRKLYRLNSLGRERVTEMEARLAAAPPRSASRAPRP